MFNQTPIQKHELASRFGELLASQRTFIFAPERFSALDGGFACGKTHAGIIKGLILSARIPGNVGMILRYHGTDLEESTMITFFELCPPSWIKSFNKRNRTVLLRNGSIIMFRHLHDAKAMTKTRRLGANLGWFFIDQAEECALEHWNAMTSRLRLIRAPKKFGFLAANPNGHDWIWEMFFTQFKPWPRDKQNKVLPLNGKFYQEFHSGDTLGVAMNSEENRVSNGGFIEDAFFDANIAAWDKEWVERYVYCSFDDFHGKIYKEFDGGLRDKQYRSVHIVEPFDIPKHWPLVVSIDVGGDTPWAVVPGYIDDDGNIIVVEGLSKRTGRVSEIASWIKVHLPWNENRTTFVMDWENKVAMVELAQDHGIHCQVARKEVVPGILQTSAYLHVQPGRRLPEWYQDTQTNEQYQKFAFRGAPREYVFATFVQFIREHDTYKWDPNKVDTPHKTNTARFDTCDANRYLCMTRPAPTKLKADPTEEKYQAMLAKDPLSAREMKSLDKRIAERQWRQKGGAALREADLDEVPIDVVTSEAQRYEYAGQGEV